jgi:Rnl2 family RNA ligase
MTEKEIKKYNSIENSYREQFIEKIRLSGYENIKYVITEKIHGSNTQLKFDGKDFAIGARTHYLEPGEKHYNAAEILEPFKPKLENLFYHLKESINEIEEVILFGEIFGGSYPHKDVPKDNHACKVQKGVFYSPSNQFMAFDIMYKLAGEQHSYLSYEQFKDACDNFDIPRVPLMTIANSLTEALEFTNDKTSVVYQYYNLPEIENNIMEGVVIKPYNTDIFIGQHRLILKNKNEKFAEVTKEPKPPIENELTDEHKVILEEMSKYVTENRVRNVISKEGEITIKDIGKIIDLTNRDVIQDYNKDTGKLNTLDKADEKKITKLLNGVVAKAVKNIMLKEY